MPIASHLLVHQITISRKTKGSDGRSTFIQQGAPSRRCMIQQTTDEPVELHDNVLGHRYNLYMNIEESNDILEGDKVIDQNGREYRINGRQHNNYGRGSHNKFVLTSQETYNG